MKGKLVLVVDDKKSVANALVSALKSYGYNAIAFYNPLEALAASVSVKPDLLLSDFNMSEMDGLTLAVKLTERHPDCKVLMMSGRPHDAIRHPAFRRFEVLQKPVSLSLLLEKVGEAIGGGAADDGAPDSEPQ